MENRFLTIDYKTEGEDIAYWKCVVKTKDTVVKEFETGDPVADYKSMIEWCREEAKRTSCRWMTLSGLNDFCLEVPGYRWVIDEDGHEVITKDETPEDAMGASNAPNL